MADENANLDIVDVDSISEMQDPTNESEVPVAQLVREGSSSRQFANIASRDDDFVSKNIFQIKLLLWKRYLEIMAAKMELLKIIGCSLMFFVLLILLDLDLLSFLPDGLLEFFIVPLAFWAFVQRIVIQIVTEKCSRVHESMKICGLTDFAYWTSYFISDGVIIGFILSILCAIMTTGGLFDNGNFGAIFGLFYVFCLSAVPFSFFLSTLMNSPQTSGQLTLLALMGMFIVPVILILTSGGLTVGSISENQAISLLCLFPPMALQLGTLSFTTTDILWPSTYPSTSAICAWMFFDIFMYLILAWYTAQVIPSPVGTTKPFYFIFQPSYWCKCCSSSKEKRPSDGPMSGSPVAPEEQECKSCDVQEAVDEHSLGKPTITVTNLKKSFGAQTAVNNLNFEMYENQIFVLLGHNGAGKTTAINMLTGMSAPDSAEDSKITVYGMDSATQMDEIRTFMGVCPQHDVLFEKLTVKEHIMFFAMLKGLSEAAAEAESNILVRTFHLQKRTDHLGHELSGGQRRKLSFAIAACGGSRFIVLDEPTAGMDPLARRELWDILSTLRHGRTILLTTHYMDEADILGDRVGIMSLGVMQCLGSTQFLKNTYGSGYTIIFDKPDDHNFKVEELTTFIKKHISDATLIEDENGGKQLLYNLPFKNIKEFGPFFLELEKQMLTIESMPSEYGMAVTTLEDVFLKVGADETVKPTDAASLHQDAYHGIGSSISYTPNLQSQITGIMMRKLLYTFNDRGTLAVLLLPIGAVITAAALFKEQTISKSLFINNLVVCALYIGAFLGTPGIIGEFLSRERKVRLRNVLTVMGCDFKAYWIGTLIADYLILLIPTIVMWISWAAADMTDFIDGKNGLGFLIILMFNFHLIALSYFCSLLFEDPSYCILIMPVVIILLLVAPAIVILIITQIYNLLNANLPQDAITGILLWGIMAFSPHGAMFTAFIDTTTELGRFVSGFPPAYASILFMFFEALALFGYCYYFDIQAMSKLDAVEDPTFDPACLEGLHVDVLAERKRAMEASDTEPLVVKRLRKVFPPKTEGRDPVVATQDIAFTVGGGQILGLLGANGAGKSTTLSMLTRALSPTSGNATIASYSILDKFSEGATHLGVVTQNNSLWDKLSVQSHLYLFARLRGVPEELTSQVVSLTIDLLELTPHRHKLAIRLSGGMKRKLCVAIALIGDPDVVLLDEPSAGLDPVSRRNLWSVILKTMSHRAVVLTTHSMEEADALCSKIAIMVLGQVQALGTKQKLKCEFGSGFELTIKMKPPQDRSTSAMDVLQRRNAFKKSISDFVQDMFPSASVVGDNGGLLTYQIPKAEFRIGVAFSALQTHSDRLEIEYYAIAQPTLEQVFIKTVKAHSPKEDVVEDEIGEDGVVIPVASPERNFFADEYYRAENKCGCIVFQMKIGCGLVFCVFIGLFFLASPSISMSDIVRYIIFAAFYLSFLTCCGLIFFIYCPCCKSPAVDND